MNKNIFTYFLKICLAIVVTLTGIYCKSSEEQNKPKKPATVEGKTTITVVYDNYQVNPDLIASWGFGCVIKTPTNNILFDTGGNSSILPSNMGKMEIAVEDINIVVISHIHGDHLGGLNGFLKRNGNVKSSIKICKDVYTTGEMGIWIKEQSLILDTKKGLVIITGCAHPGIVNIVKEAKQILPDKNIYSVMGGFHLSGASDSKLVSIVRELRSIGVQKVAPSHCSGDRCRELFKDEYRENFIESGVGKTFAF